MNALEFLLQRHAMVHSPAAGGSDFTMSRMFSGLSETEMRARPGGVNSIAWILWHVARVEDACIAGTVLGESQLLEDGWLDRLGVDERGDGEGMTVEAAGALGETVDLDALSAYRDAVCARTRTLLPRLWPDLWHKTLSDEEVADRVARGAIAAEEAPVLQSWTRASMISWWAVEHTHYHIGQAAMIRRLVRSG